MKRRELVTLVGSVATWSHMAHAQQPNKQFRIGYLALLPGENVTRARPFSQRLQELGYSEGKNMVLEYRSAEGRPEHLDHLAKELLLTKLDVLVAGFGTLAAKAAAAATQTTPVVFTTVGDPVGAGLVASLARPGRNVTGLSTQARDTSVRLLQILVDLVSGNKTIGVLLNSDTPFSELALQEIKSAAQQGQHPLLVFDARTPNQVSAAVGAAIKAGVGALLVLGDPLMLSVQQQIFELVGAAQLPAIYGNRDFTEAGGLMSYGADQRQMSRRAAEYVDMILKGARPEELPVEQATTFEFVINLRTARKLRISIPPNLLATADEVIE